MKTRKSQTIDAEKLAKKLQIHLNNDCHFLKVNKNEIIINICTYFFTTALL